MFSQVALYVSEACLDSLDGLLPNKDYVDDDHGFEEVQNYLFETLLPLINEDTEKLNYKFEEFVKSTYRPFEDDYRESIEEGNLIKKQAIEHMNESQLQSIMKSIQQKLTSQIKQAEKLQAQYQGFNIHLILIRVIKDHIQNSRRTQASSLQEKLCAVSINYHDILDPNF